MTSSGLKFFKDVKRAFFLSRPNRFTVFCRLGKKVVKAFLPNPGRLRELLLPETLVYLEEAQNPQRKMPYTAVAVEREGTPVMLHTHRTNDVAHALINRKLIPGLEGAEVIKREVSEGKSRFDFLLKRGREKIFLEVKSCTLFSRQVAMFPDAVERGKRHIEELAGLSGGGNTKDAVLFIVQWPYAQVFAPEYHTDLEFAKALCKARDKIKIIPLSIRWRKDLSIDLSEIKVLDIPWERVEREAKDCGSYLLILKIPEDRVGEIGGLGKIKFKKGYYIYVGSAKRNLSKRIERHRKLRKKLFWHIDYLREIADFHTALPVRSADDLECEIAKSVNDIADWKVPGFGCSDCSCSSHLFGMEQDPLSCAKFHNLLQFYRMERVVGENLKLKR